MNEQQLRRDECIADAGILADLKDDDLLELAPGERLWKLYCFLSPEGRETQLRHRIYTKLKADGRLALITFADHTPATGRSVRSGIARVPDLPVEMLEQIIDAIRKQALDRADDYEEADLSGVATLTEQFDRLERAARPHPDHARAS